MKLITFALLAACHAAVPSPAAPVPVASHACAPVPATFVPGLLRVTSRIDNPSLLDVANQLNLDIGVMDCSFGVVAIDPARRLFAVRVDTSRIPATTPGLASDPPIEPAGPCPVCMNG